MQVGRQLLCPCCHLGPLTLVCSCLVLGHWLMVWQSQSSAQLQPHKVFLLLLQSYEAIQRRAVPDTPLMHFLHLLIQASCCCQPWWTGLGALHLPASLQSVPASAWVSSCTWLA